MSLRPATEFPSMPWASSLSTLTSLVLEFVELLERQARRSKAQQAGAAVLDADAAVTAATLPPPWSEPPLSGSAIAGVALTSPSSPSSRHCQHTGCRRHHRRGSGTVTIVIIRKVVKCRTCAGGKGPLAPSWRIRHRTRA